MDFLLLFFFVKDFNVDNLMWKSIKIICGINSRVRVIMAGGGVTPGVHTCFARIFGALVWLDQDSSDPLVDVCDKNVVPGVILIRIRVCYGLKDPRSDGIGGLPDADTQNDNATRSFFDICLNDSIWIEG